MHKQQLASMHAKKHYTQLVSTTKKGNLTLLSEYEPLPSADSA